MYDITERKKLDVVPLSLTFGPAVCDEFLQSVLQKLRCTVLAPSGEC